MPEFFNVLSPDEARRLLLENVTAITEAELLSTADALDRVTRESIRAPQPLPGFRRSSMDGYAVRAADTHGAGENLPAFLQVTSEVPMGKPAAMSLNVGQAVIVHTGGMLPDSADAVVQLEHTQRIGSRDGERYPFEIEVFRAVAAGQNVIQIGEDIGQGDVLIADGRLLRPQDIGGLLALGITRVAVVRRPIVAILATGDEVVPPDASVLPGQVRDINSYTVAGQVVRAGAIPKIMGIVPDNLDALREAAREGLRRSDMLVISAGSSVSARDMTVRVVEELGQPGVLLHGVATRPGKPTIVGAVDGKPILGLPGNPVSAMVQFDMFGIPAIFRLLGQSKMPARNWSTAYLGQNVASETGREDYIPARLDERDGLLVAMPIFGKSNLINTLVQADCLIKVPLNKGGLMTGDPVEILFL